MLSAVMRCFYFSYHYKLPFDVYAYTFDMCTNKVYLHDVAFQSHSAVQLRAADSWLDPLTLTTHAFLTLENGWIQFQFNAQYQRQLSCCLIIIIVRPADIVVGGLIFYHGFFFLSFSLFSFFFFFRRLISELAGCIR